MAQPRNALLVLAMSLLAACTSPPATTSGDDVATGAPTNLTSGHLIACLPTDAESVLVYRYEDLLQPESVLAPSLESFFQDYAEMPIPPGDTRIEQMLRLTVDAEPRLYVVGGSGFRGPPGNRSIGMGVFKSCEIHVTGKPLTALRERLQALGDALPRHDDDDVEIFELVSEAGPVFLALQSDNVLVVASTPADVAHTVRAIPAATREFPEQWREEAAHVETESPILILRHYDLSDTDDPFSPVSPYIPEDMRVVVHGLGVDMPALGAEALRIWCRTEAEAEDIWQIFGPLWGMPQGQATPADDGIYVTVSIFPSPDTSPWGMLYLQSRLLFGQYIAI